MPMKKRFMRGTVTTGSLVLLNASAIAQNKPEKVSPDRAQDSRSGFFDEFGSLAKSFKSPF
jgi:hypothetical protein